MPSVFECGGAGDGGAYTSAPFVAHEVDGILEVKSENRI